MKIKTEEIIRQFFIFDTLILFLISWKNFFRRLFQEIRKREEEAQKLNGVIIIQIIKLNQLILRLKDVEGSKMENKLFII